MVSTLPGPTESRLIHSFVSALSLCNNRHWLNCLSLYEKQSLFNSRKSDLTETNRHVRLFDWITKEILPDVLEVVVSLCPDTDVESLVHLKGTIYVLHSTTVPHFSSPIAARAEHIFDVIRGVTHGYHYLPYLQIWARAAEQFCQSGSAIKSVKSKDTAAYDLGVLGACTAQALLVAHHKLTELKQAAGLQQLRQHKALIQNTPISDMVLWRRVSIILDDLLAMHD